MKRAPAFLLCLGVLTFFMILVARASQEPQAAAAQADPAGDINAAQLTDNTGTLEERIARGFEIAPVPLDLRGKDAGLVGLGSYLVNAVGGCNDCHTNPPYRPGGDPFQGEPGRINTSRYLAGGTHFGPVIVSRNLTPQAGGRPAGLTFNEFRLVMRTGADLKNLPPQNNDLLQVMPWPVFRHMRLVDLRAIYEYLRAIPSRPSAPSTP
jgi:hypothetical protein